MVAREETRSPALRKPIVQCFAHLGWRIHKMQQLPLEVCSRTVPADSYSPLSTTKLIYWSRNKESPHSTPVILLPWYKLLCLLTEDCLEHLSLCETKQSSTWSIHANTRALLLVYKTLRYSRKWEGLQDLFIKASSFHSLLLFRKTPLNIMPLQGLLSEINLCHHCKYKDVNYWSTR